ncbi:MAG: hypothetical protein ABI572_11835 [Actinomycetota bacterium]
MQIRTRAAAALFVAIAAVAIAGVAGAAGPGNACGEQINGTGPEATVSYEMCPGDPGLSPEPLPGPQIVEPTPGMANVRARPYDTAVVGPDDRTVTIDFWSGIEPCTVLDRVQVAYGPNAVTITLFEGNDPTADDVACIEIAVQKRVVITLDASLGGRDLVDGAAA